MNREVLRVVAAQMRDHIAILKADYDTLDGAQPKVVDNAPIPDYMRWVEAKIAGLRDLFGRAEHLLVVDLQEALTASDVASARIATAHWLHACDDVCYGAIAWETDARAMPCPPRLAEAHRRLFGQTLEAFDQIEALPEKIEAIASQETHDGSALSSVLSSPGRASRHCRGRSMPPGSHRADGQQPSGYANAFGMVAACALAKGPARHTRCPQTTVPSPADCPVFELGSIELERPTQLRFYVRYDRILVGR